MASPPTVGLTNVTDPTAIGKVILVFEPNTKFPWLAPALSENYVPIITGYDLVERRCIDFDDKVQGIMQHFNGDDMYFVVDPAIVKIKILNFIMENTPDTVYYQSQEG